MLCRIEPGMAIFTFFTPFCSFHGFQRRIEMFTCYKINFSFIQQVLSARASFWMHGEATFPSLVHG